MRSFVNTVVNGLPIPLYLLFCALYSTAPGILNVIKNRTDLDEKLLRSD
jgi:hypothetical protein